MSDDTPTAAPEPGTTAMATTSSTRRKTVTVIAAATLFFVNIYVIGFLLSTGMGTAESGGSPALVIATFVLIVPVSAATIWLCRRILETAFPRPSATD